METSASKRRTMGTMSTPHPTTNTPSGARLPPVERSDHRGQRGNLLRAQLQSTCCRCKSTMEPSAVSTTAKVALSGSTNSSAVYSYPIAWPTVWVSAAAASRGETSMTPQICRAASWSLQHTDLGRLGPGHTGRHQVGSRLRRRLLGCRGWRRPPERVPLVAEPVANATVNSSASTVTPSAFSPSTSTMRTTVGVIDTPRTMSTTPPKPFANDGLGEGRAPRGRHSQFCAAGCGVTFRLAR